MGRSVSFTACISACAAVSGVLLAAAALVSACGSQTSGGDLLGGAGDDSSTGTSGGGNGSGASSGGSPGTSSGTNGSTSGGGASSGSSGSNGGGASSGASSSGGSGSSDAGAGGSSSGTGSSSGGSLCLKAGGGDYAKTGPYSVSTLAVDLADAGLSGAASPTTFTIYYPSQWESGCLHPIAAWGNGTGVTGQQTYQFYNQNVASWGIVVIASDNSNVAQSPFLATGIDYLIAQNNNPSSVFYKHLSTKAGVAGHSQGGMAATAATMNANVVSEVCIEGGGTPKAGTSVLCLTGSNTDGGLNPVNAIVVSTTYPQTTGPAFLADWDGGDHVTTPTLAGWFAMNPGTIQFVRLMTAWYRCFLAGDGVACGLFKGGTSCGVCKDPGWYLMESRNL
ncbi:MAG: hypothetical protein ACRENE_25785 [Polyangiaceae bacterium]